MDIEVLGHGNCGMAEEFADSLCLSPTLNAPCGECMPQCVKIDARDGMAVKDTLFIIDRSSSISPGKFTEFKTAVLFALDYLNPGDRFDIGSFSDRPFTLSRQCIPATAGNLELGREYVRKLTRGGMTDVFAGIQPFVKSGGTDTTRPLNIFLLTDGVSTVKNIYKGDVFLRSITGINPGNVSIFPFSAGKEANRELLDFLGFLNRGYSAHAETLPEVRASLAKFISNLSGLLIMDVQYMAPATLSRHSSN